MACDISAVNTTFAGSREPAGVPGLSLVTVVASDKTAETGHTGPISTSMPSLGSGLESPRVSQAASGRASTRRVKIGKRSIKQSVQKALLLRARRTVTKRGTEEKPRL